MSLSLQGIRFYLNDQLIQLDQQVSPVLSLLRFIRETIKLTGTKEGCGEGDCGACTVVIASLDEHQQLQINAVNSCLLLLGLVHQKAVFTIEYLNQTEQLHPIQQAFVDQHASQCGFCTSGFIMSVYGQYQSNDTQSSPDAEQIKDLLAGNLCRCTGYGNIIRATQQVYRQPPSELSRWREAQRKQLLNLKIQQSTCLLTDELTFFTPQTSDEVCRLLDHYPQAQLIAGGTDLGLMICNNHQPVTHLVAIKQIVALQRIEQQDGYLNIGSAVTYSQFMDTIQRIHPAFYAYLLRHSSRQIRNQATIVGNIANASPVGDMAPALIALNSQLLLISSRGERSIRLADYFIAYRQQDRQQGEYIKAILIPIASLAEDRLFRAYKVSKRQQQDITTVSAGFYVHLEKRQVIDFRAGFAGLGEIPQPLPTLTQWLIGKEWNQDTIYQAQHLIETGFTPHSGHRGSSAYRLLVAKNLLFKFFLESQSSNDSSHQPYACHNPEE